MKAQGFIDCRSNELPTALPRGDAERIHCASTQAVIGKATLLLEEHQNWGKQ